MIGSLSVNRGLARQHSLWLHQLHVHKVDQTFMKINQLLCKDAAGILEFQRVKEIKVLVRYSFLDVLDELEDWTSWTIL